MAPLSGKKCARRAKREKAAASKAMRASTFVRAPASPTVKAQIIKKSNARAKAQKARGNTRPRGAQPPKADAPAQLGAAQAAERTVAAPEAIAFDMKVDGASDMQVNCADVAQSVQAEAAWPNAEQSEAEKEDGMEADESGETPVLHNPDGGLPLLGDTGDQVSRASSVSSSSMAIAFDDEDKNDEDAGVDAEHLTPVEAGNGVKGNGFMPPAPAPVPSPESDPAEPVQPGNGGKGKGLMAPAHAPAPAPEPSPESDQAAPVPPGNDGGGKGFMAPARAPAPVPSPADKLERLLKFGCPGKYWQK